MPTDKPDWWDDLEDGTREDATVNTDETERHYVRANGKRYWFDIKEVTWNKKNEFASNALKIGEDATELHIDQYYLDILQFMIDDMSVEGQSVKMFLIGVEPELGSKLQELAPKPGQALSDQEEGNSDGSFEELERDNE